MISERRQHIRYLRQDLIKVDVVLAQKPEESMVFDCYSKDFSRNGIRLHGHKLLELGSQLTLVVHLEHGESMYNLNGVIKWVTETTEHEVVAGIELIDDNTSDIKQWQSLFES